MDPLAESYTYPFCKLLSYLWSIFITTVPFASGLQLQCPKDANRTPYGLERLGIHSFFRVLGKK